jgi:hypothetical protein
MTPYLTIELGLRWDWNGTPGEALDRFSVFDPTTGGFARPDSTIDNIYGQNARNFQPRVGFAWDMFHTGKTVLRGGYGFMSDQPVSNSVTPLASNPPFANPVTLTTGTITFANAFTAAQAVGLAPNSIAHDFKNPYVQSWNLNVQHQLTTSTAVMVGYFGSKGTQLRMLDNINQPFSVGGTVRPFASLVSSNDFACPVAPATACPTLGNILQVSSGTNSRYDALWTTATKRLSHGLQVNASYTYSKSIDYNSLSSVANPTFQDSFNPRGDRGLSDYDARHRFVVSGFYELPFNGNRAIEGWQLSTIVQLQTGNPVNIVLPAANLNGVGNTVRPDVLVPVDSITTGYNLLPNGNLQYFPQAACSATVTLANCLFFAQTNHFGSLGRNSIIGPGFENIDFSVLKNTKVTERLTAQFRADMFDLFNHPNFGQPNRVVTAGTAAGNTFGQITNTRFATGDSGSARQLQFAVKLLF